MDFSDEVGPESIWEDDNNFYQENETLVISIFHIDPMLERDEIKSNLQRVLTDIHNRFEPWLDHYIWNQEPVKFEMCEHDDVEYIYGKLVFGDYYNDEWLVTQILFELSKTYEDLYIHLSDNEGELILIEGADQLPEWIEPGNAKNRDWINHGRILIIPEEYYKDRGLKMKEALKFLDRAVYKCLKIAELDKVIISKLKQYPTKALEGQVELEITLPREYAGLLMKSNILNQAVIAHGKDIQGGNATENLTTTDLVDLKIRTTALAYLFTDFYAKSQNESQKLAGGKLVTISLQKYLNENPNIKLDYKPTDKEIQDFNLKGDVLQKELIRLMRIDKYVEPNIKFDDSNETENPENDDLVSKLETFFKDTNAGLDGVENKPQDFTKSTNFKIEELEPESEDSDEEDEEARKYLAQENIDIDEDDFFEFFAKEALKLSDEDLETFRNMKLDDEQNVTNDQDEEDYEPDSDEEELLKNFASGDATQSIQELLKSLQTEGGANGPAATLLQSLGMNITTEK
ncbi:hypothetical protein BN7_2491 [Wickerhamomyces ciferrii]|uniref:Uncharacterized protein n=1 Tax=Wickerhamomyces ciferrii (strain ATCC 14091 / BCRC 22168 / CBS 111 / JCM 3599 / NBRC 0793 / NRRL Y-1031 F-60-10) TaxID=1206466 RepID=K0KCW4_WICCF|nr:uncharacterized protein BN7_2491 [Wickerhamomyces ciferrii]CCH42945.1 hypothetical protein BN7_2491 [Wickerhamomyces ciferrii]